MDITIFIFCRFKQVIIMRQADQKKLVAACERFLCENQTPSKYVWHQKLEQQIMVSLDMKELGIIPVPVCDEVQHNMLSFT